MNGTTPAFETDPGFLAKQFPPTAADSAAFEPPPRSETPAIQLRSRAHPAEQEEP
jgi:hypothetical protein